MWKIKWSDNNSSTLRLEAGSDQGCFTPADLLEFIGEWSYLEEGVKAVKISCQIRNESDWPDQDQIRNESDCPDQDLEAVGNALTHLRRFDELQLAVAGSWSDAKLSVLLRHVPKRKVRSLLISGVLGDSFLHEEKSRVPSVIAELQKGEWLAYHREFNFWKVDFDERDCVSLGEFLQSRQQETEPWIHFTECTFPSFKGYLIVAEALIDFGPYWVTFEGNAVEDKTIPSSVTSLTHKELYNRFEREGKDYGQSFNRAAAEHLAKYSDLNEAGRLELLDEGDEATREQWLDVLGNYRVRGSVDCLFHLLLLKPGFIHP